jgi:dTDP-4-dehydrorhamnose 3,5-epimerase
MALAVETLALPELRLIRAAHFSDDRGWFTEIFSTERTGEALNGLDFVQDNASLSVVTGTVRGLHYQLPPFAQDKLIMLLSGAILDVAVDIRRSSPTFGRHLAIELAGNTGHQLFIPAGFAHGFVTLEPNTLVLYKVSRRYAPEFERGIAWDDSDLGITWPLPVVGAHLSDKDKRWPRLRDAVDLFD